MANPSLDQRHADAKRPSGLDFWPAGHCFPQTRVGRPASKALTVSLGTQGSGLQLVRDQPVLCLCNPTNQSRADICMHSLRWQWQDASHHGLQVGEKGSMPSLTFPIISHTSLLSCLTHPRGLESMHVCAFFWAKMGRAGSNRLVSMVRCMISCLAVMDHGKSQDLMHARVFGHSHLPVLRKESSSRIQGKQEYFDSGLLSRSWSILHVSHHLLSTPPFFRLRELAGCHLMMLSHWAVHEWCVWS